MQHTILVILAAILLVPGIPLALAPVPNMLYMLLIAVGFGFLEGFVIFSATDLVILSILTAIVLLADFLAGVIGAKVGGAHWSSILWGLVGLVLGSFLIPIPILGSVIGMFLGILASELFRTRDMRKANKAALGSFWGWLAGTGFRAIASVVFLVLFVIFAFV